MPCNLTKREKGLKSQLCLIIAIGSGDGCSLRTGRAWSDVELKKVDFGLFSIGVSCPDLMLSLEAE
jgi:hypothetical protein